MKNYQRLHYNEYYIMLSDGSSVASTRQECFTPETVSEDCSYKQRWYYSPDQHIAIRLPRNALGEQLGKNNAAELKAIERVEGRNREHNLEIDAHTTEDGVSYDIPDLSISVEYTAIRKAQIKTLHKAVSELPEDLQDLYYALLREEKQNVIAERCGVTDAAIRKRIKKLYAILQANKDLKNFFENP